MRIALALFTYNRPDHTIKVIDALYDNTRIPEKVFIFQDGLRDNASPESWNKVNRIITSNHYKNAEVIVSDYNKGLASSIVEGVTRVLTDYDAVIVLEDDCVPSQSYIDYMYRCLQKYENDKQIWQISGYAWPFVDKGEVDADAYFCGRMSSWGWGTWKDRWYLFNRDTDCLRSINSNPMKSRELYNWGRDLTNMLVDSIVGNVDSWAVYYALQMIDNGAYSVAPYVSLIRNIGFDGSGTNCRFEIMKNEEDTKFTDEKQDFILPDAIEIKSHIRVCFAKSVYGLHTTVCGNHRDKNRIIVYGAGNYFMKNEEILLKDHEIIAFIDKGKKGFFAGKAVIEKEDLRHVLCEDTDIVVMLADKNECLKIARMLHDDLGIDSNKITIGVEKYKFTKNGGMLVDINGFFSELSSIDEYNNVCEVLLDRIYEYSINNNKKDVVIDVGMNVGDASWFFLNELKVDKVYGYEPFFETFKKAVCNLSEYSENNSRLECFNYGISNVTENREIVYNPGLSCAMSSIPTVSFEAIETYSTSGLATTIENRTETIHLERASEVFENIVKENPGKNIVLKMDCEGEEYSIIEDLALSGVLNNLSFIMMEWHYMGASSLLSILLKHGFSYWCSNKHDNMGLIYAYNTGLISNCYE